MDGNKDEALKCLRIGRQALDLGDRIRALKFITKARRLDPNLPVDDLLSTLEGESRDAPDQNSGPGDGEFTSGKPNGGSSARIRVPSNGSSSSSSSSSRSYTEEQILIVKQIKKQKDYYELLGVERTCSVEEVRKAYRKLSLKVHPDKNKAPGSEEAFKAVSKAFQCLSDEERRKSYDLLGSEEVVHERSAARRGQHGFNGFYDADVDAEEIFRNFFFGGMPRATTQFSGFSFGTGMGPSVRRADHGHSHGSGSFNPWALVQLLPILLVFLLNLLPSSEPIYALSRFYPYEHQFVTQKGVNYYVKESKFEHDYPPDSQNRVALEDRVEREYFSLLAQNCQAELQRFHWGYIRETPHCDRLKQFKAVA